MRPPPSRLNLGNWKVMRPLLYRFLCQALTAPAAACRIQPFKLMKRVVEMVLLASALRVCISTTLTLREERRGEEKRVANGKSQAVCLYLRAAIKREKRGGGKKRGGETLTNRVPIGNGDNCIGGKWERKSIRILFSLESPIESIIAT